MRTGLLVPAAARLNAIEASWRFRMHEVRFKKSIVVTALLFLCAAPGWAQEDGFPKFYFATPLSLESGREFGVQDGTRNVDDTAVLLNAPTFTLGKLTPRTDFALSYESQFELFTHYGNLSSWNHEAGFRWSYKMTPRWSIDAGNTFVATRDEDLRFDSAFLLPRGPYKSNSFSLKLNYDLTPATRIKLHYDDSFVSFSEDYVPRPLFFSLLTNTYGLSADHRFSPKSKLTADYSYLTALSFDQFDRFGFLVGSTSPSHLATLTYDYNLTSTLLLEASGGYIRNVLNSYVFSGLMEKRFNKVIVGGGYSRYLSVLGTPATPGIQAISGGVLGTQNLTPNTINDTASLHVRGDVSDRVNVQVTVAATRTTGLVGQDLKGMLAGLRVSYRFADHLAVFWDAQYFSQNANAILPDPISRKRLFAGIEYIFSPSPEQIARQRAAYSDTKDKIMFPGNESARPLEGNEAARPDETTQGGK
jgi:hypothetical protein